MATVVAPPRAVPKVVDVREPKWLERIPVWASTGAILVVLLAASAYFRTTFISGQFWMDEAITTGIASHPLSQIPGILRHDGSPPLFYVLLHFWISAFGASETANTIRYLRRRNTNAWTKAAAATIPSSPISSYIRVSCAYSVRNELNENRTAA